MREYGWGEVQVDLARGVNPKSISERFGEPVDYILEVADAQGWPVTWNANRSSDSVERLTA